MKCDLHIHAIHSGKNTTPVLDRICRESYNDPEEVYAALKGKAMDLVTITDHDSVGSGEVLCHHPDFFLSEEVTCRMPSGTLLHVGVYDVTERQHIQIQKRRDDLPALLAYLTERRLFFTVNHMFSSLTGRREIGDFAWFEDYFPAFETLSGQMPKFHNRQAERFARREGKVGVGGSDAHALASVGSAYTEVPGARDKVEFLEGLRAGAAVTAGSSGGYFRLTRDIFTISLEMMGEHPWKAALSPLMALIPVATLAVIADEMFFARRWSYRVATWRNEFPSAMLGASTRRPAEVFAWP